MALRSSVVQSPTIETIGLTLDLAGYLDKLSSPRPFLGRAWQPRWFELHAGQHLVYYHHKPAAGSREAPAGVLDLRLFASVAKKGNEIVLTPIRGNERCLRTSVDAAGASKSEGQERAAADALVWYETLMSMVGNGDGPSGSEQAVALSAIHHKEEAWKAAQDGDPEVVAYNSQPIRLSLRLSAAGVAAAASKAKGPMLAPPPAVPSGEKGSGEEPLPWEILSVLFVLGVSPGGTLRAGAVHWAMRASIFTFFCAEFVLKVLWLRRHYEEVSPFCAAGASMSLQCANDLLVATPKAIGPILGICLYLLVVRSCAEETLLPTHRHRLKTKMVVVVRVGFAFWLAVSAAQLAVSQIPDCKAYLGFEEQWATVAAVIDVVVAYGFAFVVYAECTRLLCMVGDFEESLQWASARAIEGVLESSNLSVGAPTLGACIEEFQRLRLEFSAVQGLLTPAVEVYAIKTACTMAGLVVETYNAPTRVEVALHALTLLAHVPVFISVLWVMARANEAGGSVVGTASTAIRGGGGGASGGGGSSDDGLKLLVLTQAAPCTLSSLGKSVSAGDIYAVTTSLLVAMIYASFANPKSS